MKTYYFLAVLLNFFVNLFLLLGANAMTGHHATRKRIFPGALLAVVYGLACMSPKFSFLVGTFWHLVSMSLICAVAFGFTGVALRSTALFFLFQLAITGVASGAREQGVWSALAGVGAVGLLWILGFWDMEKRKALVPVELVYRGRRIKLTALRDTGNTLRDPITGQVALIVGADVAQKLTGLTQKQLQDPVETMRISYMPGMQLIPYSTIGKSGGMLLAMRMKHVTIDRWTGSSLVAFAPESIGDGHNYQALTGGIA